MDEYELLKLGALLHDVGKIVQRNMGKKKGTHSEQGYDFLKVFDEKLALFSKFHHIDKMNYINEGQKIKNLLWIVYEADNLSSKKRGKIEGEFNPKNPLVGVFSRITGINKEIDETKIKEKAYPLTTFGFDDFVFPGFDKDKAEDRIKPRDYEKIVEDFKHEMPLISTDLILSFLEKEATFIPARTGEDEDISLFDHLKTTCAISSCMYLYHKDDLDKNIKDRILDKTKYLLISGDISGIQKFIYNITSEGALKLLRARSFFLEVISEDFVQELLDELYLSRANLLYCAGGHFYILAPDTKECTEKVEKLKRKLNEWLLEKFEGNLYYAVDYISFGGEKFEDFSGTWRDIGKKLAEEKSKKFKEMLVEETGRFLREDVRDGDYYKKKECKACKKFVSADDLKIDEDKKVGYCNVCYNLKNVVGKKLKNNKFILRFKENDKFDLELPFSKIIITNEIEGHDFNTVYQINSFDIPQKVFDLKQKMNFNFVPLSLGAYHSEKDFDNFAKDSIGVKKVGILRMDVDNLGRIFREGLPKQLRTISRITNLSRFLNYFFKGYLNLLGEFEEKNVRGICNDAWDNSRVKVRGKNRDFSIVYAGGDDLLIAGAWDDVFELAFDIHALFRRYVGENDNITISASFCLFDPKFPFYKMAEISGIKEEKAKDEDKNRIWMFDRGIKKEFEERYGFKESIGWEKFLEVWKDFNSLQKNGVSKGAITKLLNINNLYKENPDKVSWAMNLAYWYGKLEENEKKYFDKIIRKYSIITVKQPSEIYSLVIG